MITRLESFSHERLPNIKIILIDSGAADRGEPQRLLIEMQPGAKIPRHRHNVEATMDVVCGTATVLSDDDDDGVEVASGMRVHFPAHRPHGFTAGPQGFTFLSTNGGIVGMNGEWDMEFTTH